MLKNFDLRLRFCSACLRVLESENPRPNSIRHLKDRRRPWRPYFVETKQQHSKRRRSQFSVPIYFAGERSGTSIICTCAPAKGRTNLCDSTGASFFYSPGQRYFVARWTYRTCTTMFSKLSLRRLRNNCECNLGLGIVVFEWLFQYCEASNHLRETWKYCLVISQNRMTASKH